MPKLATTCRKCLVSLFPFSVGNWVEIWPSELTELNKTDRAIPKIPEKMAKLTAKVKSMAGPSGTSLSSCHLESFCVS